MLKVYIIPNNVAVLFYAVEISMKESKTCIAVEIIANFDEG